MAEAIGFEFQCSRKRIDGSDEKKQINKAKREAEKASRPCTAHAVFRRGGGLQAPLWIVSSPQAGVPFVEALLEQQKQRPIVGFAKSTTKSSEILWAGICELDEKGREVVREIQIEIQDDGRHLLMAASIAADIFRKNGAVVSLANVLPEDAHIAYGTKSARFVDGAKVALGEAPIASDEEMEAIELIKLDPEKCSVVTKAIKNLAVPATLLRTITTFAVVAGVVGLLALMLTESQEQQKVQVVKDRNAEYKQVFADGIAPKAALLNVYKMMVGEPYVKPEKQIGLRDKAAGWTPRSVEITASDVIVKMGAKSGARIQKIQKVAAQMQAGVVAISESEVAVVKPLCKTAILEQAVMIPVEGVANYLIAAFQMYSPNSMVNMGKEVKKDGYALREMIITLKSVSAETVDIVGSLLNHLPINFKGATFEVSGEDGLMDGRVTVEVIGCGVGQVEPNGQCKNQF